MAAFASSGRIGRRRLLLAAAAGCCAPFAARSAAIYTPHEIAREFDRRVTRRLQLPDREVLPYAGMAEMQVMFGSHELLAPQYLLLVDGNPHVQAALLMWRLAPGTYDLLGASPVSTGGPVQPHYFETPQGVFERTDESLTALGPCDSARPPICPREGARVLDFGWQRARNASGRGRLMPMRLQARAADPRAERRLGAACSDGCILLPASLMHLLDELGLLDAGLQHETTPGRIAPVPYRGRYLLVVDSGREERPAWSPAPR